MYTEFFQKSNPSLIEGIVSNEYLKINLYETYMKQGLYSGSHSDTVQRYIAWCRGNTLREAASLRDAARMRLHELPLPLNQVSAIVCVSPNLIKN